MSKIGKRVYHYGPENPWPAASERDPHRLVTDKELAKISEALLEFRTVSKVAELACEVASRGPIQSVDIHKERMSMMAGQGSPDLANRLNLERGQRMYMDGYEGLLLSKNLHLRLCNYWGDEAPKIAEVGGFLETLEDRGYGLETLRDPR